MDSTCLQVQDREGLNEEEEKVEKEEEGTYREGDALHPPHAVQDVDTRYPAGVPSPSALSPTHMHHHLPSPTHSVGLTSPSHSAPPPASSSYTHFSPPPSPIQHQQRAGPVLESIPGGLLHHPVSAIHHSDQNQVLQQNHLVSSQRSLQKHNPGQGQWLQQAKVQVVRTSQPTSSAQSSMVFGSSAYSQFAHLPRELAELGESLCQGPLDVRPSPQVQTGLGSGASYTLDDVDVDLISQLRATSAYMRGSEAERVAVNRFAQSRQFSRNQSKAAYYPMEVTEAVMGPPDTFQSTNSYQYQHQGGLRRPLSAHPTSSSAPAPRPLIHSQSVSVRFSSSSGSLTSGQLPNNGPGFRTSASAQHMDIPSDSVGGVTGYHDDLFLMSSPQSEMCMAGGGTYPGEAGRSSRNTPFMGVIDKTGRVHQQYQQQGPSSSPSCLSPSRSWAVSSVDTVVTSPSKNPANHGGFGPHQPSSIAYYNRSNNNGHLLHDNLLDSFDVVPDGGLAQVACQHPSFLDMKVARTLPAGNSCSDRPTERRTGPTSPVKPKRPFVESNV